MAHVTLSVSNDTYAGDFSGDSVEITELEHSDEPIVKVYDGETYTAHHISDVDSIALSE